ncbi:LysR family transcriptional regulator [Acuticoccus sp. I52.16.1]|uniref:LysR family transcriptional regulator n=1 Tax=Acuticoccus sp. I52.16.1 TaxID=2928472 RepID=UPI001FD2CD9E|nr:LysR family transcriptional regulator [Acuticoccus sp. I52.16.1]UOM35617.1 LysR family transcriptional regulator [Acuticoccus sp. I52.16.1]
MKGVPLHLRQLEAFRMTVEKGSITRAAEAMSLSQPAVTKLVAALEADLGFSLFERTANGVVPTPEGVAYHGELERALLGLARLEEAAREIRGLKRGHVRIGAMPAVATAFAPDVICSIKADHPGMRVILDVHTSQRVADLTAAAAFDLGFAHLPERRNDIEVVASYGMDCVVVMPPDHPLAALPVIRPADLSGIPMVALGQHTVMASLLDAVFADADVARTIAVECQPSFAACALVVRRAGVAIVDPLTPQLFGPDQLVTRPFIPTARFTFRLIRPIGVPHSHAAQVAVDAVLEMAEKSPAIHCERG